MAQRTPPTIVFMGGWNHPDRDAKLPASPNSQPHIIWSNLPPRIVLPGRNRPQLLDAWGMFPGTMNTPGHYVNMTADVEVCLINAAPEHEWERAYPDRQNKFRVELPFSWSECETLLQHLGVERATAVKWVICLHVGPLLLLAEELHLLATWPTTAGTTFHDAVNAGLDHATLVNAASAVVQLETGRRELRLAPETKITAADVEALRKALSQHQTTADAAETQATALDGKAAAASGPDAKHMLSAAQVLRIAAKAIITELTGIKAMVTAAAAATSDGGSAEAAAATAPEMAAAGAAAASSDGGAGPPGHSA